MDIVNVRNNLLLITAVVTIAYQLFFFFIAAALKVDTFTDLAGGSNFVILAFITWGIGAMPDPSDRQWANSSLVILWGIRLSAFLFIRILNTGEDQRFDNIRGNFLKFLAFWVFQMVWVFVVSLPLTFINALSPSDPMPHLNGGDIIGLLMASMGLLIESIADQQKFNFKNDPSNKSKWIATGVWKYSRHPNYFGELFFWWGIFISCSQSFASLNNTGYYTILSPLLISWLLLGVSGMPILELNSNKRFVKNPEYLEYRNRTSILFPIPPTIYGNLPPWFKSYFLFEWKIYAGGLDNDVSQES